MENQEAKTGQKWGIWLFLIYTMVTLLLCLLFFFMLKVPFSSDADYLQAGITGGAMGTGAERSADDRSGPGRNSSGSFQHLQRFSDGPLLFIFYFHALAGHQKG